MKAQARRPGGTPPRRKPDPVAIEKALRGRFADWERRLDILRRRPLLRIETEHKPLYATVAGMEPHELKDAGPRCRVRGALPEPIRIAHLVATAIVRGESKGDA